MKGQSAKRIYTSVQQRVGCAEVTGCSRAEMDPRVCEAPTLVRTINCYRGRGQSSLPTLPYGYPKSAQTQSSPSRINASRRAIAGGPYCSARSSAGPSWRVKLSAQLIRLTWLWACGKTQHAG